MENVDRFVSVKKLGVGVQRFCNSCKYKHAFKMECTVGLFPQDAVFDGQKRMKEFNKHNNCKFWTRKSDCQFPENQRVLEAGT